MPRQLSREARQVVHSDRKCTSCKTRHVRVIPEQRMTQAMYFGNRAVDTRAAMAEHATGTEYVETKMTEKSFGLSCQHGSQEGLLIDELLDETRSNLKDLHDEKMRAGGLG